MLSFVPSAIGGDKIGMWEYTRVPVMHCTLFSTTYAGQSNIGAW